MENKVLHKYIAVTIAVAAFLFLGFGTIFFPILGGIFDDSFDSRALMLDLPTSGIEDDNAVHTELSPEQRLDGALVIFDILKGSGEAVSRGDTVRVGYVGTFVDTATGEEVEFDKNIDPESGLTFTLGDGRLIAGFDAAVEGMRPGGIRAAVIQPEAGYGGRQVGNIPPDTTLQFVIELYEAR